MQSSQVMGKTGPLPIVRDYGMVETDGASFDALVERLRARGFSLHPSVIGYNWEPRPVQAPSRFQAVALNDGVQTSQQRARYDIDTRGLRSLTPREMLAFLVAHVQSLDNNIHFVTLGYIWHDIQSLPAALNCFRFVGRPHIGPVPAHVDGSYPRYYHFIATPK